MIEKRLRVAVVGGGIGGLTTAIALREAGLQVEVFEQAPKVSEVGAGLGVAPNAVEVLKRLGLGKQIAAIETPLDGFTLRRWNGQIINHLKASETRSYIDGSPVHRADLLMMLHDALPEEVVHAGKKCVGLQQDKSGVQIAFADGSTSIADAVIGADGIHSVVRNMYHTDQPVFSNQIAYRGLVPMERLSEIVSEEEMQQSSMWLGPQKHFLVYPISRGRIMNMVAFVPPEGDWRVESWTARGEVKQLAEEFRGWDEKVVKIINALDSTLRWALYDREPLDFWSVGRVTLVGDAAHAMLPHQGQGAGQSIEDARFLALSLQQATRETIPQWLKFYEEQRRGHTARVQQTTRVMGQLYDLPDDDVARRGENFSFADHVQWIVDYDVDQAFQAALQTRVG